MGLPKKMTREKFNDATNIDRMKFIKQTKKDINTATKI